MQITLRISQFDNIFDLWMGGGIFKAGDYNEIIIVLMIDIVSFFVAYFIFDKIFKSKSENARSVGEMTIRALLSFVIVFCTHTITYQVLKNNEVPNILENQYYIYTLEYIEEGNYEKGIISFLDIPDTYQSDEKYSELRNNLGISIVDYTLDNLKNEGRLDEKKKSIEDSIAQLDTINYDSYEKLNIELENINKQIEEENKRKEIEAEKKKIENAKKNQLVLIDKMNPKIYSRAYMVIYNLHFEPLIINKTEKDIRDITIGTLHYDREGYPHKDEYNSSSAIHFIEETINDVNITRNSSKLISHYSSGGLDSVIKKVHSSSSKETIEEYQRDCQAIGCVKSVTFYDGSTWDNEYYKYWLDKYKDQRLI